MIKILGLAAAAMLALSAVPQRAEALSLINPGAAPAAKAVSGGMTTEVFGRGGSFHGGGAVVHGGSFRSSGAVSHSSAFRAAPVYQGSGFRTAHVFHGGFRHSGFAFRHHRFHRHFFYGASYYPYYDYPYYYSYRRCHVVWTDYGPRRVCHYRHWRHHYYWHHHHHHHHRHHRFYR